MAPGLSNIGVVGGIFFVLENAGIHLAALLAVFAGAAARWRIRLQNIANIS